MPNLPQMILSCDPSFGKHYQTIIDRAIGGGVVCGLGEKPLRDFLTDISITLKPQQDFIVEGLEELRRSTEVAVAALEESGSPFKHTVVRNLKTHHAAYVTFTKVFTVLLYRFRRENVWGAHQTSEKNSSRGITKRKLSSPLPR